MTDLPSLVNRIQTDWWQHMIVKNNFITYDSNSFFRIKSVKPSLKQIKSRGPSHSDISLDYETL